MKRITQFDKRKRKATELNIVQLWMGKSSSEWMPILLCWVYVCVRRACVFVCGTVLASNATLNTIFSISNSVGGEGEGGDGHSNSVSLARLEHDRHCGKALSWRHFLAWGLLLPPLLTHSHIDTHYTRELKRIPGISLYMWSWLVDGVFVMINKEVMLFGQQTALEFRCLHLFYYNTTRSIQFIFFR